jgi:hypothetical protein
MGNIGISRIKIYSLTTNKLGDANDELCVVLSHNKENIFLSLTTSI